VTDEPATLVLVDDHPVVRGGLRAFLELQPDLQIVGEAADGEEAVAMALSTQPDVVLMDIRMPVCDGIAATRTVTRELPRTRVVMLTTFDLDDYVVDAFRAGAS
jgi:DNA-binding NarL/FixJ family response regulator